MLSASSAPLQPEVGRLATPVKLPDPVPNPPEYWMVTECAGTAAAKSRSGSVELSFILREVIRLRLTFALSVVAAYEKSRPTTKKNDSCPGFQIPTGTKAETHGGCYLGKSSSVKGLTSWPTISAPSTRAPPAPGSSCST